MRLIDADELIKWLKCPTGFMTNCEDCAENDCIDCIIGEAIMNAPTIEAESVRHGRWKLGYVTTEDFVSGEYDETFYLECPFCGRREYDLDLSALLADDDAKVFADFPYCHCGAKMDGGANDENA